MTSEPVAETSPLAAAERAIALASSDPKAALCLAQQVLATEGDLESTVVARRAAGLAELQLGNPEAAKELLVGASALAEQAGLTVRKSEVQRSLAFLLLHDEQSTGALDVVEAAIRNAPDSPTRGAARAQRAVILMRLGRYEEALRESELALPDLRPAGNETLLAYLRSNRGNALAYLGDFELAERELRQALHLHEQQGSELSAVQVGHNLGFVAARRGDVPAALRHYAQSLEAYERLGLPVHPILVDRCEVLMSAHLLPEARSDAEQAVRGSEGAGLFADAAEARLMLAEVALACGDPGVARREAALAASALERQQRRGWFTLARYVETCARLEEDISTSPAEIPGASMLAHELELAGWRLQATEIRIAAAKRALARGDSADADTILSELRPLVQRMPAAERVRRWYAEALGRLSRGNRAGSLRALEAGLRVAEQHQTSLRAMELRARAATGAADLALLGLELALRSRDPRSVLLWADRCRARSYAKPRALPPQDSALARSLAELRHVTAEQEKATLAGRHSVELEHRRQVIETEVRLRSLCLPGRTKSARVPADGLQGRMTARRLMDGLGDRLLLEFVSNGDELYLVACTCSSVRLFPLQASGPVERESAALRLAFGRLAYRRSRATSLVTAARLLRRATAALDEMLLGQVQPLLAEVRRSTELILCPTGGLHGIPWALLPTLRGRPALVVPSAELWLARQGHALSGAATRERTGHVVVVGGPGVASGSDEVEMVRTVYPRAVVLAGEDATVARVLSALEGATMAHVVAHGRFRSDNPLFSALELRDGPLTVYDLETLQSPPRMVVLSSCDAGRAEVHPGDELMGTSAALLSMGTDTIVASVAPVPDAGMMYVMTSLHESLVAGARPAAALASAQSRHSAASLSDDEVAEGSDRALTALAAGALVCLGSGQLRLPGGRL